MPVPIFDQVVNVERKMPPPEKAKVSGLAVFLSFVLVASLIFLVEFAFRDGNRLFNPYYEKCVGRTQSFSQVLLQSKVVRNATPTGCELERYERTRLILHADLGVPIILLGLFSYALVRRRKPGGTGRILYYTGTYFVLWVFIHLVGETEYFFIKHHPLAGKYILLGSVVIIVLILILYIQRRMNHKAAVQA